MEENTAKTSKISTGMILGGLAVVAIIGVMMLKPKTTEMEKVGSEVQETTISPTASVTPTAATGTATITVAEMTKHNTKADCWVQIDTKVYDVTKIIPFHKGGEKAITDWCGKDGSTAFNNRNGKGAHPAIAMENLTKVVMGLFEVK